MAQGYATIRRFKLTTSTADGITTAWDLMAGTNMYGPVALHLVIVNVAVARGC